MRTSAVLDSLLTNHCSTVDVSCSCSEAAWKCDWPHVLVTGTDRNEMQHRPRLTNFQSKAWLINTYPIPDRQFDRKRNSLGASLLSTITSRLVRRWQDRYVPVLAGGRCVSSCHVLAEIVRSSGRIAVHETTHMSFDHRRAENVHDLCESLDAASCNGAGAVGDEDDSRAVSGGCVESISCCGIGDDAWLVAFAAVASFEMLRCLGCFSCVRDDASDGVLVVEKAVDYVHALACVGADD
jgi:hypothetical protein